MNTKINAPRGEEVKKIHDAIIADYLYLTNLTSGKDKMKLLDDLAKKYGYTSGQSIRNIIVKHKKSENAGIN